MNWTTIDYDGKKVGARDFLDGVLVRVLLGGEWQIVFVPGYYVQEQLGDMDGPALRQRKKTHPVYGVELRVQGEVGDE